MARAVPWICREAGYWQDRGWKPGMLYTPEEVFDKYELRGDMWGPVGVKVFKVPDNRLIPGWMEPTKFSILKDPRHVLYARNGIPAPGEWAFDQPTLQAAITELPLPEPLTAEDIAALDYDPAALMNIKPGLVQEEKSKAAA